MRYRGEAFGADYRDNLFSAQFNTQRIQRHPIERRRRRVPAARTRISSWPSDPISIPPTCWKTPTAACWSSTPAAGSASAVRRRRSPSRRSRGRSTACAARTLGRRPIRAGCNWRGTSSRRRSWSGCWTTRGLSSAIGPSISWPCRARRRCRLCGRCWRAARRSALAAMPSGRSTRQDSLDAQAALCQGLRDTELSVRLAAAHAVGLHRTAAAIPELRRMLNDEQPAARRAAAAALGRIKPKEAVPTLLAGLRAENDRFLDHALIYALLEIADAPATRRGLNDPSPHVRRGALVALDQMDGGSLTRDEVVGLLNTSDAALQKAALSVITAQPEWAGAVAGPAGAMGCPRRPGREPAGRVAGCGPGLCRGPGRFRSLWPRPCSGRPPPLPRGSS